MSNRRIEYLFRQYSNDVHNFLVYFTRTRDVEDLVQETFLRAIRRMDELRMETARSWLITIARNAAFDASRKTKRLVTVDDESLQHFPSHDKTPEEWIEAREDQKNLIERLGTLKSNYQEVIIYRTLMTMTSEETANVLGWSLISPLTELDSSPVR